MGDKISAKKMMIEAHIPVVPGSTEVIDNLEKAKNAAKAVGNYTPPAKT